MTFLEHSNVAVKKQFVAAVFAGDHDTIRRLAHRDFELHEGSGMPFAGIYRGADGFITFLGIFGATFDIKRLEETGAFASEDPDRMVFQFELEAVFRSAGTEFSSSLIEAWQFKDNKVLKISAHYFNSPFQC
jgi:ketosteroid isomerase-like protein